MKKRIVLRTVYGLIFTLLYMSALFISVMFLSRYDSLIATTSMLFIFLFGIALSHPVYNQAFKLIDKLIDKTEQHEQT